MPRVRRGYRGIGVARNGGSRLGLSDVIDAAAGSRHAGSEGPRWRRRST
jgi:hypothetical protein